MVLAQVIATGRFVKLLRWSCGKAVADLLQSPGTAQLRKTLRQGCGRAAAAAAEQPPQLQQLQQLQQLMQLQLLLPRQLQPLLRLRWCLLL